MSKRASVAAALTIVLAAASAEAKELFFYNWSNYYPPELLKKFEAETGIRTTLDVYGAHPV
jgi:spermidine/putrescine transport system substrate-binding protein